MSYFSQTTVSPSSSGRFLKLWMFLEDQDLLPNFRRSNSCYNEFWVPPDWGIDCSKPKSVDSGNWWANQSRLRDAVWQGLNTLVTLQPPDEATIGLRLRIWDCYNRFPSQVALKIHCSNYLTYRSSGANPDLQETSKILRIGRRSSEIQSFGKNNSFLTLFSGYEQKPWFTSMT